MTNQLIIFSKNRACQLQLLIESIKNNANLLFDKINVLYTFDYEFNNSYNLLIDRYPDINFIKETSFKNDLLVLIDLNYDFTTFLVDDAIVYNHISDTYKNEILSLVNGDGVICFSLRLGLNCTYSHPANMHYQINDYKSYNTDIILFNFRQQIGDFGYPLSTDGHIFKTRNIRSLIKATQFSNPNTLEANLQSTLNIIDPIMFSFKESKVVSVPVNLVNTTFNNKNGLLFGVSALELNNRFINGEIIDLYSLDFSNINGPHKEIKYIFKNEN